MVWAVSLSTTKLSPHSLTPGLWLTAFVGLVGVEGISPSASIQSPTSVSEHPRLYLNTFRGVRAITKFVWHITSIHNSSRGFATPGSSGLHPDFIGTSPWSWIAHLASRLIPATINALFRLAFAVAPRLNLLTSCKD